MMGGVREKLPGKVTPELSPGGALVVIQRIARRDKKAFLSNQCKEIEENNRMGKTRDVVKKIRDPRGIFHAKMGLSIYT